MRNITFVSTQDQTVFRTNTSACFNVLVDKHDADEKSSWIFLHTAILPLAIDRSSVLHESDQAQLFHITCSLVQESTILNSTFANLYKIFCLAKDDHIVNFKRPDYLPLVTSDVDDVILFEVRPFDRINSTPDLRVAVTPTVLSFFQQSVVSLPAYTMPSWHSDQYRIVLDSSDKSNARYRDNTGCSFDLALPQPIDLHNQRWELELNSLFIHKRVFSVFPLVVPSEDVHFSIVTVRRVQIPRPDGEFDYDMRNSVSDDTLKDPNAAYQTFDSPFDLVRHINSQFRRYSRQNGDAKFVFRPALGKIVWTYGRGKDNSFQQQSAADLDIYDVYVSMPKNGLGKLLGFVESYGPSQSCNDSDDASGSDSGAEFDNADFKIYFSVWRQPADDLDGPLQRAVTTIKTGAFLAFPTTGEIFPKTILVTCNLVKNSSVGGRFVRLLRVINTKENFKDPFIVASDFEHSMPVDLDVTSFASVHIQLCALSGQLLPPAEWLSSCGTIKTVVELTLRKCDIN